MIEVICDFCHKPIFGSDHLSKMIRTKYHAGCRTKANYQSKKNKLKQSAKIDL